MRNLTCGAAKPHARHWPDPATSPQVHHWQRALLPGLLVVLPGLGLAQTTPIDVLSQFTISDSQREVARAIGTLCPAGNRVNARLQSDCNNLVGAAFQGAGTVRGAISAITPDSARVAVDRGQFPGASAQASGGAGGIGAGGYAIGGSGFRESWWLAASGQQAEAVADFGAWGLYATLASSRQERDASPNQDGYDDEARSLLLGVDRRLAAGWSVGAGLSVGRRDADYTGASGSQEADDTALNLHAGWSGQGWYADTLLSLGQRETEQARRTQYGNANVTVNQIYRARYDSDTQRLALTLGHRFGQGTWSLDPYVQFEKLRTDVDAYDEVASAPDAPGGGWAVSVDAQEERQLRGTLGLRASWVVSGDSGVFLPYLDAGWVTLLDSDENDAFVRYTGDRSEAVGLSGLRFAMRADAEDDSWGRVAVGIAAQFAHGRAGFLRYVQTFGEDRYARRELQLGGRLEF